MSDARWYVVMNNLLYPAVLGTLIYTGFDKFSGQSIRGMEALLALALFALYVMDYAHSVREDNRKAYSAGKFLADVAIVACLFFAGHAILDENIFPAVHPAWWLLGTKAAAIAWECRAQPWSARKRVEVETDSAFALVYLITGIFAWTMEVPAWFLALVLAADAFYYYLYEWLVTQASKSAAKAPARLPVRRRRAKAA